MKKRTVAADLRERGSTDC